jgi:hypothetical protein
MSELYHLADDPKQTRNVIADHRAVAQRLHEQYIQFLRAIGTSQDRLIPRQLL